MTKELLFELRPAEFWVWNYLLVLAREQGGSPVTIPRPGKDPLVEKVYSRKHLIRLLRSLRRKACLTRIIIPRSKSNAIEVYIPGRFLGYVAVPQNDQDQGQGSSHIPQKQVGVHKCTPKYPGDSDGYPNSTVSKLSLMLKELKEAKQGLLMEKIQVLDQVTVRRLRGAVTSQIQREVKCRVSEKAKLFAEVRYFQEEGRIGKPQAWLDTVARKAREHFA